jgi:hypothetical protein
MRLSKLCAILFLLFAGLAILIVISSNASADTHYWDGESTSALFSNDTNWAIWGGANDVEPTTGDNVMFWDWDDSCTWDVAVTVGNITIAANYTGTITQGAVDFGYADFSMAGGVWASAGTNWQTCTNSSIKTAGAIDNGKIKLKTSGTVTLNLNIVSGSNLLQVLWVDSGTATETTRADARGLILSSGASLVIPNAVTSTIMIGVGGGYDKFTNNGSISATGTGVLKIFSYTNSANLLILGTISCPLTIEKRNDAANHVIAISGNSSLNSLTVSSLAAANTITLNLAGNSLDATTITASTRGIITNTGAASYMNSTGALTVSGASASISGPIIVNAGSYVQSGASSSVSMGANWALTGGFDLTNGAFDAASFDISMTTLSVSGAGTMRSTVAGTVVTTSAAISVGAGGTLLGANIVFNCGGNWVSHDGTWTAGDSLVSITSQYRAISLAATQTFYDLQLVNNVNVTGAANVTHLIKYVGVAASQHWHWYYGTTLIINETSNASGVIDLPAQVMAVHNLYKMTSYPFITSSPALSVVEDHAYSYDANADQAVTWSITTNATWASFVIATGVLSGTPDNGDVAIYSVSIRCVNANGTSEWLNYSLTVTNVAPVFNSIPNAEAGLGFVYVYQPSTDEDAWVTWTLTSDSPAMQLDSTGLVYGHIKDVDSFYFNITANDGKGGISYQNVSMSVVYGAMNPHISINATESGRLRISFSAELTNAPQEYIVAITWNFGDGIGSHEATPVHSYPNNGTYLVTVAMWLINGDIAYKQIYVSPGDPLEGASTLEAVNWWATTYGMAALGSVAIGMLLSVGYAGYRKKKRKNVKSGPLLILWLGVGALIFLIMTGGLF